MAVVQRLNRAFPYLDVLSHVRSYLSAVGSNRNIPCVIPCEHSWDVQKENIFIYFPFFLFFLLWDGLMLQPSLNKNYCGHCIGLSETFLVKQGHPTGRFGEISVRKTIASDIRIKVWSFL